MRSPALATLLRPMERFRRILWFISLITTLGFIHEAYFDRARFSTPRFFPFPFLSHGEQTIGVVALAVGEVIYFWLMPRLLLPDRRLRTIINQVRDPESLARNWRGRIDDTRLEAIGALSLSERRQYMAARAGTFPFISQLAFAVSVTIFGLMLVMSGHAWPVIVPFAVVTIALLLTLSPRVDSVLDRAERVS